MNSWDLRKYTNTFSPPKKKKKNAWHAFILLLKLPLLVKGLNISIIIRSTDKMVGKGASVCLNFYNWIFQEIGNNRIEEIKYLLRREAALAQKKRMITSSKRTLATNEKKLYPARSNRNHNAVAENSTTAPPHHFFHSNTSATIRIRYIQKSNNKSLNSDLIGKRKIS